MAEATWFDKLISSGTAEQLLGLGVSAGVNYFGLDEPEIPKTGYQGTIPTYNFTQDRVPNMYDPTRRPGSSGRRYFTDAQYTPQVNTAPVTASGLAAVNAENTALANAMPVSGGITSVAPPRPAPPRPQPEAPQGFMPPGGPATQALEGYINPTTGESWTAPSGGWVPPEGWVVKRYLDQYGLEEAMRRAASSRAEPRSTPDLPLFLGGSVPMPEKSLAAGGIAGLNQGRYLGGPSDGMADKIPARIDGTQEARLSGGEFVWPADVVSDLGNGNSDAGARHLYSTMDRIRNARHGTKKQGKQIDPNKFLRA
jgi:hypothetical protein